MILEKEFLFFRFGIPQQTKLNQSAQITIPNQSFDVLVGKGSVCNVYFIRIGRSTTPSLKKSPEILSIPMMESKHGTFLARFELIFSRINYDS